MMMMSEQYTVSLGECRIDSVHTDSSWIRTFRVNGTEIPVKLDSGAQGNVMSVNVFKSLQHKPTVKPMKTSLIGFGGNKITPRGIVSLNIEFKDKKHSVEFFVIEQTAQTLLGLPTCRQLDVLRCIDLVRGVN